MANIDDTQPAAPHGALERVVAPGMVTLTEAARGWDVSVRTLRRRIAGGELPDAVRITTRAGQVWHIPPAALARLGYKPTDTPEPTPVAPVANDLLLVRLTQLLERQQSALEAATDAKQSAAVEAATLRAEQTHLTAERDRVTTERDALTTERDALAAERDRLAIELAAAQRRRWRRRG